MALIEIDGLPINSMVIFHGYVSHNQMVNVGIHIPAPWFEYGIVLHPLLETFRDEHDESCPPLENQGFTHSLDILGPWGHGGCLLMGL